MTDEERMKWRVALEGNPVFTDMRMELDVLRERVAELEAELARWKA